MNFDVAGYELDAYWPDHRFAVELDVFETHGTRAAFERDRAPPGGAEAAGHRDDPRHPARAFEREPESAVLAQPRRPRSQRRRARAAVRR